MWSLVVSDKKVVVSGQPYIPPIPMPPLVNLPKIIEVVK